VSKKTVDDLSSIFLKLGVDDSPYIVSGSGQKGYGSIIMGPTDKIIEEGDLFIIDTGSVFDSYYCDFDRNYAFGSIRRGSQKSLQGCL
jgi:Xaa-Pro aminopeptidase